MNNLENGKIPSNTKQPWTQRDVVDIVLLYHMGAKTHEMSHILKRSESSITKKFNRIIIKPPRHGGFQMLPNRELPAKCSIDEFFSKFIELKNKHFQHVSDQPLSETLDRIDKVVPLHKVYDKGHRLMREGEIHRSYKNQWKTVEDIYRFLKKHGRQVGLVHNQEILQLGYQYTLNGKWGTASMLLKETNMIMRLKGEHLIYVENLTEDCR